MELADQLAQVAPNESKRLDGKGHRQESGLRKASRELNIPRDKVARAVKIASLTDDAKAVATERGLDDNQSALLDAAKIGFLFQFRGFACAVAITGTHRAPARESGAAHGLMDSQAKPLTAITAQAVNPTLRDRKPASGHGWRGAWATAIAPRRLRALIVPWWPTTAPTRWGLSSASTFAEGT